VKSFNPLFKYTVIIAALSAIPFISGLPELQGVHGHVLPSASLQAQPWFASHIHLGEKILWCSGISPTHSIKHCMPIAFVGVLIAISGVLFIGLMGLAKQIYTNPFVKVTGSLVIFFGILLASYPYWARYHCLHSACVLTDSRAIKIFSDKPCESIPYTSENIEKPFELSGSSDGQTLKFYRCGHAPWTSTYGSPRTNGTFEDISDGTTALEILTAHTSVIHQAH
jgi:hypothetical protein